MPMEPTESQRSDRCIPCWQRDAERIDPEMWGLRVYTARYESPESLDRLVTTLSRKIRPFRDQEDPTAAYVGRDLSALPAAERRGFEIARIPRHRTSAERLTREGKDLISESAIFRARVFAWLADSHLHIDCPENLWLREHLLLVVWESVRRGHRLTPSESAALEAFVQIESAESVRDLGDEVLVSARRASVPSPAEIRGLPALPPELPDLLHPGSTLFRLRIAFTASGEPVGLRVSSWPATFSMKAADLRKAMAGEFGPPSDRRNFVLEADGPADQGRAFYLAEIEDALDALAGPLGTLTLDMARGGWTHGEIETFLQATVCLAILRELRRRRVFEAGQGEQEHDRLARELGYIWGRPATDFQLFEFAAGSRPVHFRGLFPWGDVKEQAVRVQTAEAARVLQGRMSEAEIFEQAMGWDRIPAQLWDAILRTRMPDVVTPSVMRDLWARYVLPSAFLYWKRELIYTDPTDTRLWAYV